MKKKILFSLLSVMFLSVGMKAHAGGNNLSVKVSPNEYSIKESESESSLTLKMQGEEKTQLKVKVTNSGSEDSKVDIFVNNAHTTGEGKITYSENERKLAKEEDSPLAKMISDYPKNIEIKAGKTKEVTFNLAVPKGNFAGVKLAGIHLINSISDSEKDKMFKNRFAYTIPVLLTQSDRQVKADMALQSIENIQDNKKNYLEIKIDNISRSILSRGIFKLDLYKGKDKVFSNERENLEVAPMSTYPFRMQWSDNTITPGIYTAKFSFDTPYGVWNWEEEFEISKKEAKKLNDSAIHVEESKDYTLYGIIAVVTAVVLGFIAYLYKKKKAKTVVEEIIED